MRFGIVILPEYRWAEAERRWRGAEELGFDHAWTYDHLGWRDLVDGPWFDAVPTLTAAALVTRRIRLGTYVASPNFRHPVTFARQVTALDDVSNGRFLLGVGAGGVGFDSTVLGQRHLTGSARIDRYVEFVLLLDRILTTRSTTWTGTFYSAVDARSAPRSLQRPRVPLLMAGNARRSIALAARHGDGWVTTGPAKQGAKEWWLAVSDSSAYFVDALRAEGREPSLVRRYLSLDAGPLYSLTSVDAFTEAAGRAKEAGFTDVISHWPRARGWYAGSESTLEAVGAYVRAHHRP